MSLPKRHVFISLLSILKRIKALQQIENMFCASIKIKKQTDKPKISVSTAFLSSFKLSKVFL